MLGAAGPVTPLSPGGADKNIIFGIHGLSGFWSCPGSNATNQIARNVRIIILKLISFGRVMLTKREMILWNTNSEDYFLWEGHVD